MSKNSPVGAGKKAKLDISIQVEGPEKQVNKLLTEEIQRFSDFVVSGLGQERLNAFERSAILGFLTNKAKKKF